MLHRQIKHLTLNNRVLSTARELAYSEVGLLHEQSRNLHAVGYDALRLCAPM
ncbi:MAG: hypothetical protein ABI343_03155 [Burkholderiaceae bacterium]